MRARAQILIIVAVLIPVILLLLAAAVDTGRIFIERERLQRAAQSAADAGISVVAERMVTLAVARQTLLASTPSPTSPGTMTATPVQDDIGSWLNDDDRATLVSEWVRATAAEQALEYAIRNGFDPDVSQTLAFEVTYPQPGYDPSSESVNSLSFFIRIRRSMEVLLAGLIGDPVIFLESEAQSDIPQR